MGNSAACDVPTDTASVKQPQLVEISEVKLPSSTPPWRPDSTAASNLVWTALYEFETMARKRKVLLREKMAAEGRKEATEISTRDSKH